MCPYTWHLAPVTMTDYTQHQQVLEILAEKLATKTNSIVISDERFSETLSILKGEITPKRSMKRWINQRKFRLIDMPGVGLMDVLVSEVKDPKDGSKYRRVVQQSMMYDVIKQVHAEELQHSGYKKVEAYVSTFLHIYVFHAFTLWSDNV